MGLSEKAILRSKPFFSEIRILSKPPTLRSMSTYSRIRISQKIRIYLEKALFPTDPLSEISYEKEQNKLKIQVISFQEFATK